jgi:DNA-directed RNA polymerase subunit RPC12/RpoP
VIFLDSILEYMWIKVLADGETMIPQFDYETGQQNKWYDCVVPISKVILTPIPPDLVVKMEANGIPAQSSLLPTFTFNVLPDDDIIVFWDNAIVETSHYECLHCGWSFKHHDSTKFISCPQCGIQDGWKCERCGKEFTSDKTVRGSHGEVNCPECEIPYGLVRKSRFNLVQDVIAFVDYCILIKDKLKVTIKNNEVVVDSL